MYIKKKIYQVKDAEASAVVTSLCKREMLKKAFKCNDFFSYFIVFLASFKNIVVVWT